MLILKVDINCNQNASNKGIKMCYYLSYNVMNSSNNIKKTFTQKSRMEKVSSITGQTEWSLIIFTFI